MDRIRAAHPPHKPSSSSPSLRLLGLSDQQRRSDANPVELDESDVVWSSANDTSNGSSYNHSYNYAPIESTSPSSPSISSTASESPTNRGHPDRQFRQQKFGLSSVLADEHPPLVRRKASPSVATTTAVRTIPRSSPSSDGSIGSAPGRMNMSAPVNIPVWGKMMRERSMRRWEEEEAGEEEEEEAVDGEEEEAAVVQAEAEEVTVVAEEVDSR